MKILGLHIHIRTNRQRAAVRRQEMMDRATAIRRIHWVYAELPASIRTKLALSVEPIFSSSHQVVCVEYIGFQLEVDAFAGVIKVRLTAAEETLDVTFAEDRLGPVAWQEIVEFLQEHDCLPAVV